MNRGNVSHYQLRIDMQEGSKCENVMSLEYFCSEYSLESECRSACGPGAQNGKCRWLPENRYLDLKIKILLAANFACVVIQNNHFLPSLKCACRTLGQSYSTCTTDLKTCPDGQCDNLEKLHSEMLCPQDCLPRGI